MKRIAYLFVMVAAVSLASCAGKSAKATETAEVEEVVAEEVVEPVVAAPDSTVVEASAETVVAE